MSISERVETPNPLEEGLRRRRTPEPCALTIFGASGDLTQRKLFPALYALAVRDLLPPKFGVVGVARTEMSDEEFREKMKQAIQDHARDEFRQDVWDEFAESIRYVATDFADQGGEEHVVQCLNELDEKFGTASNRIYYLAVPPSAIETIVVEMGKRRAAEGWTRVIVEKPFGYDLETAQAPERGRPPALRRGGDLPDRPLPRQGDGPEHAGPPLRERDLRADLEPPVHRPRADHGRRVARDRRAAPTTTSVPEPSATSSRTTCSSSSR